MINPYLLRILMRNLRSGNLTLDDVKDENYKKEAEKLLAADK